METDIRNMKKHWDTRGRTGTVCKNGYRVFSVGSRTNNKREYEHHIVWKKFFGDIPDGFIIHHKDGNKLNNDISNLVLMSLKEHARMHAKQMGLGKDRNGIEPTNKTSKDLIERIKNMRVNGALLSQIAEATGLSYVTVQKYAKEV